jgi:ATP-binding cassette subfamily B protein
VLRRIRAKLEPAAKYAQALKFLWVLKGRRRQIASIIGLRTISMLIGILPPLLVRHVIDRVVPGRPWSGFWVYSGAIAALLLVSLALVTASTYLTMRISNTVSLHLRRIVLRTWGQLTVPYFGARGVGDHIYHVTTDVENVGGALLKVFPDGPIMVTELLVYLIVSWHLEWRLTLYFIAAAPFLLAIESGRSRRIWPVQRRLQELSAKFNNLVSQYGSGILTTKIFRRERAVARQGVAHSISILRETVRKWRVDALYQALGWGATTLWSWVVIFYGLKLVMDGRLTLGTLVALRMYLSSVVRPVEDIRALVQSVVVASVSSERLLQTLNAPREQQPREPASRKPWPADVPRIVIRDLSFGYRPGNAVFRHLSGEIIPGSLVGLTGPSGVGKTTLVSLIGRLYDPWEGSISIAGTAIGQLDLSDLRGAISIVPQEAFLYHGTIRDNIACGCTDATFREVIDAAKRADADDFIVALPNGYDTLVGGELAPLSAGQRQRIAIARALARNCRVLIFDEGMNAVDAPSRARILDELRGLAPERAVVIVTHDLEVLRQCDTVMVMSPSALEEQTPAQLMSQSDSFVHYLRLRRLFATDSSPSVNSVA